MAQEPISQFPNLPTSLVNPNDLTVIVHSGTTYNVAVSSVYAGNSASTIGWVNLGDSQWGITGTNDTAAIQNAVNYACNKSIFPNGTIVWFNPTKNYNITGTIYVPKNPSSSVNAGGVVFMGAGKKASNINVSAAGGVITFNLSPSAGTTNYGSYFTAGDKIALQFNNTTTGQSYKSPVYTVQAWDGFKSIAQNLVALINNDTSPNQPVYGTNPWMNCITSADYSNGKGTYLRTTEIDFTLLPSHYNDVGTFSALTTGTISCGYNPTVSNGVVSFNPGVFSNGNNISVNFNIFSLPINVGNSATYAGTSIGGVSYGTPNGANSNGFGAEKLGITFAATNILGGAAGGSLFTIPNASFVTIKDLYVLGAYDAIHVGQSPIPGGNGVSNSHANIMTSDFNFYNNGITWDGPFGNCYIEHCYVHGSNSQDPNHAAFYMKDIILNYPNEVGGNIEQFYLGAGVDVEGCGMGIWGSFTNNGINDSILGGSGIDSDSCCVCSIFLQSKPYSQNNSGCANNKIGSTFESAGTHSIWLDGGGNGLQPSNYGQIQDTIISGGHPLAGNATSNYRQPFGCIQIVNPQMQAGIVSLTSLSASATAPVNAPTCVQNSVLTANSQLIQGTYYVSYAYVTSNGATAPSPATSVVVSTTVSNQGIGITLNDPWPTNATGVAIYASHSTGSVTRTLQTVLSSGALYELNPLSTNPAPGNLIYGVLATPSNKNYSGNVFSPGLIFSANLNQIDSGAGTFNYPISYTTVGGETITQVAQYLGNLLNNNTNFNNYFIPAWAFDGILFFELLPAYKTSSVVTYTTSLSAASNYPQFAAFSTSGNNVTAAVYSYAATYVPTNISSVALFNSSPLNNNGTIVNNQGTTINTTTAVPMVYGNGIELSGLPALTQINQTYAKGSEGIGIHLGAAIDTTVSGGTISRYNIQNGPSGTGIQIEPANYGSSAQGYGNQLGGFNIDGIDLRESDNPIVDNFSVYLGTGAVSGITSIATSGIRNCLPYSGRGFPILQPGVTTTGPASGTGSIISYTLTNNGPYDWDVFLTSYSNIFTGFNNILEVINSGTYSTLTQTASGTGNSNFTFSFSGGLAGAFVVPLFSASSTNAIKNGLNSNSTFAQYYTATSNSGNLTIVSNVPGNIGNSVQWNVTVGMTSGNFAFPTSGQLSGGSGGGGFVWGPVTTSGIKQWFIPVGNSVTWHYSYGQPTFQVRGR